MKIFNQNQMEMLSQIFELINTLNKNSEEQKERKTTLRNERFQIIEGKLNSYPSTEDIIQRNKAMEENILESMQKCDTNIVVVQELIKNQEGARMSALNTQNNFHKN
jgi:hypothetical protein